MDTKKIAILSIFTALCIGIQLAPRPPNIEFTSFICFVIGAVYGCVIGSSLGALTMFINGFLSPWGIAGMILPFQMAGMSLFGLAGGIFGKLINRGISKTRLSVEAAILGAFFTLMYDLITNFGFAILYGLAFIPILIFGMTFSIVHICCNTLLLGIGFAPLFRIIKNFQGESKE